MYAAYAIIWALATVANVYVAIRRKGISQTVSAFMIFGSFVATTVFAVMAFRGESK